MSQYILGDPLIAKEIANYLKLKDIITLTCVDNQINNVYWNLLDKCEDGCPMIRGQCNCKVAYIERARAFIINSIANLIFFNRNRIDWSKQNYAEIIYDNLDKSVRSGLLTMKEHKLLKTLLSKPKGVKIGICIETVIKDKNILSGSFKASTLNELIDKIADIVGSDKYQIFHDNNSINFISVSDYLKQTN